MRSRSSRLLIGAAIAVFFGSLRAYGDFVIDGGVAWLNTHQNVSGTWGSTPELTPRDTARVVMALSAAGVPGAAVSSGLGWIGSQSLDANQFLAEHALALTAAKLDPSAILLRLAQQRSATADYGGFRGHSGDVYDSALALQAFAAQPDTYAIDITTLVTFLALRQNGDGGWGINQGFDSNALITAEVLLAFGSLKPGVVSPAVITAGQTYLGNLGQPNGSFGGSPLLTAVSLRALLLTGYADLGRLLGAFNYLGTSKSADGSWGGDPYTTARAVEARTMNKPNVFITSFTLAPSTVVEGGSVTATVKVSNNGIAPNPSTRVTIREGSDSGRTVVVSGLLGQMNPGDSLTFTIPFAATNMAGVITLAAVVDGNVPDLRDDNSKSATLTVNGKPDLQLFPSDITTSPPRLQPGQQGQVNLTVHNGGESSVAGGMVALSDILNLAETLVQKVPFGAIPAGGAQTVIIPVSLMGGVHGLKAVADPDGQIDEKSETNNTATRVVTVSPSSSIDLRIASQNFTVSNPRPAPGDSITIAAVVRNDGTDEAQSTVAFYDGPPGPGARLIAALPLSIAAQSSQQVQTAYTVLGDSRVIYAVADPDGLLPEMDETNNAAFATLTDQFADLALERDSFVMPKTALAVGQSVTARIVVRNKGLLAATHAEVVVYDDLPQSGGVKVLDTFVDVPALGKVVVPAAWTVRAGQRIGTAQLNPTRAVFEPDYSNNQSTRLYIAAGNSYDDITVGSVNASKVVVNATDLTVSGTISVAVQHNQLTAFPIPYVITAFDDVDGDRAYNPEVDVPLGSAVVDPREQASQQVSIAPQGQVRFVPPRLMVYIDSTNAVSETREDNNLFDAYGSCSAAAGGSFTPQLKWSTVNGTRMLAPVARMLDTNGDEVIDANDAAMVVQTNDGRIALRRANGELVWVKDFDTRGRQISPVVADLDGDGRPEILAHTNLNGCHHCLVALNAPDGSVKWTSPELEYDPAWNIVLANYSYAGAPAVADLDGDGKPEVISGRSVLRGLDGTVKWVGTGGRGRAFNPADQSLYNESFPDQEAPIAVDLDGDGKLEVVAGNTAYRPDGTILWQRSDLPDGYTAPVYLTNPPKICLVALGNVYLLNPADGTNFWATPRAIPGGAVLGGAPTVFSQFGLRIGVAGDKQYTAWQASDGAQAWTRVINSDTSYLAKSTNAAAAFNMLGGVVLVYAARDRFVLLDSGNGGPVYSESFTTSPFYPGSPSIADLDEDGFADIIVGGDDNLRVLSNPSWNTAPSVYNEFAYHVSNVSSDAATIPPHETPGASTSGYRFNTAIASAPAQLLPNLAVCYPRIDDSRFPQSVTLVVRVGNNGLAATPAVPVKFYSSAATPATLLGTATSQVIPPGGYQDVSFTLNNPAPGTIKFYAVADEANTIRQCRATTNRSPDVTGQLTADIAVTSTAIFVDDPRPRPGDTLTLIASATVLGGIDPATVRAQFFLGDPAAGGTAISPVLPVTVPVSGDAAVDVTYAWTVNAPSGPQILTVVFDPANAVAELNETNNRASYALNVSTADPVRKITAALTLTPPAAESGTPVSVQALIQNIGNVTLSNVTVAYSVAGGPFAGGGGTATIAALPKNDFAIVSLGTFTPAANATYTVTLAATDSSVTVVADPRSIAIAPFATASFTAVPTLVPTSNPLVQLHTRISKTNTIIADDDPLVPVLTQRLQKAADYVSAQMVNQLAEVTCFQCHVTSFALSGLESARHVPGVTLDDTPQAIFRRITSFLTSDGHVFAPQAIYGIDKTTTIGAIGIAAYHDADESREPLRRVLEQKLLRQNADGSFGCEGGCYRFDGPQFSSWDNSETHTWMSIREFGRGFDLTGDPRYAAAIDRAAAWCTTWTGGSAANPEPAARVAMGLHDALPYLTEPSSLNAARAKMIALAQFLRSVQNADGSWGIISSSSRPPIIPTAQAIQAVASAGTPLSDPQLRAGLLWLINAQDANGGWMDHCCSFGKQADVMSWAMQAIPAALLTLPRFDVDLNVTIPPSAELTSASPSVDTTATVGGGKALGWKFAAVSAAGSDLYFTLRLNGLQNQETRSVATSASLHYKDPYSGNDVTRPITIPTVTGVASVGVSVATDATVYQPGTNVTIGETVSNAAGALTNDLVIRDSSGATVATLAAAEPLAGLPQAAFPGWHYTAGATAQITAAGVNRTVAIPIDFAAQLASIGVSGTFDRHSIRVTADAAPAAELQFFWMAIDDHTSSGTLVVSVPDGIASGASLPLHVAFDTLENGVKPVSTYDRIALGVGQGLSGTYWALDLNNTDLNAAQPSGIAVFQPPFLVTTHAKTTLDYFVVPTFPTDRWVTNWTGAFFAPIGGTYQFLLGSRNGSWLDIDGVQVVNNSGRHEDIREITTSRNLTAGLHTFKVTMYNFAGTPTVYLKWAPPGSGFHLMTAPQLFTSKPIGQTGLTLFPSAIPLGGATRSYVWNTGGSAAGTYTAVATLRDSGVFVANGSASFAIAAATRVAASISTDKAAYDNGQTAHLNASIQYTGGSVPLTGARATVSVLDSAGATLATATTNLPSLQPAGTATARLDWSLGAAAPGAYTARVTAVDAANNVLAAATAPFRIRSTAENGQGITGTLSSAASVAQGDPLTVSVSLTNGGNAAVTGGAFAVNVVDPSTQAVAATVSFTATIAATATTTRQVTVATASLAQQHYSLVLTSLITGAPVSLASAAFDVVGPRPQLSVSVSLSSTAVDPGDTLHATAEVTYLSGPATVSGLTAAFTIADGSAAVVANGSKSLPTLTPGQTTSTTFDFAVASTPPGTYTLTVTVKDAAGAALTTQTATFTVRSTATAGKGVTGTINTASSVVHNDPLAINVSVTDGGNAALTNAPFTVQIVNTSIALPFSASVAVGATYATTLTAQTSALSPGTYSAVLVSMITGAPVPLATTSFVVTPQPASLAATLSSDKSAYDPGEVAHVTGTVSYATGDAVVTNAEAIITVGAQTSTTAIASLGPGQSVNVGYDWSVGTTAPGSYTVTLTVKDPARTYVTRSIAIDVRSTATTGKGVTGTINTASSVVHNDPLAINVSVTDGGNAALTNAPFAVQIVNTSIALPFTASVAVGATYTTSLTAQTSALSPGTYDAVLVSMITGAPVPLATASFVVTPQPASLSATLNSDKSAYDPGEVAHVTGTVSYATGDAVVTNAEAIITVGGQTSTTPIASLGPAQSVNVGYDWSVGTTAPGSYTVTLTAKDAARTYVTKSIAIDVRSTATTGKGVTGTINTASSVVHNDPLAINVSVTDGGNAALTNAPFAVQIVNTSITLPFTASVAVGATYTTSLTAQTSALSPGTYDAVLVSMITGTPVPLATTSFVVTPQPASLSATLNSDKSAYDPGEVAHVTGMVSYATGDVVVTNAEAIVTVGGQTSTTPIASLGPGQSVNVGYDWSVGTSAPGSYTVTLTVKDPARTYVTRSIAIDVRSTAATGKGVTGTINTASSVVHNDPLAINVSVTDGGNAALTNAPFAVQIVNTSIALPFSASVAVGATYATTLTAQTSALSPGTYSAVLVSMITGTAVPLATSTFEVTAQPAVLTATLSSDKSAYDPGEVAHVTGTVAYLSGEVAVTNAEAMITVAGQTSTTAIASLGPGQSVNVAYDWSVGATPPGSYTVTLTVHDATRTYAASSIAVGVRSTAVTGKGVTGTITTAASVSHNDPLPIDVSVIDGGNAALTNAPFAVQIVNPSTQSVLATMPFTASVAVGAAYAASLTAQTAALTPGTYSAVLVSMITGAPVPLASAAFEVTAQPASLSATLNSDKSAYDPGEVAHVTGTVSYPSGDVTVTNAEAIISVAGQTSSTPIASLAPGGSVNVAYDWSVGTAAPGTYTVLLVVKDATRTYVTRSITVAVRSTAVTGKGVSATVTAPTSASAGDAVVINVSLTNAGNADLVNASYTMQISDPVTHAVVDAVPFHATVAAGTNFQIQLTWSTASRTPQTYSIEILSLVGDPIVLATRTIELKPALAAVSLDVSSGGRPRVLIWADCASGNSAGSCTPAAPPRLTQTLTGAGLPWKLVGDQYTFMTELRTGGYAVAVIDQPGQAEPKVAGEYLEDIRAGFGLLFIDDDPNAMPKLEPALGVSFRGRRNATSTLLDVLASPFSTAGQLSLNGNGVKIDLNGAVAAAKILATGEPAIAYNTFAAGRTVVIPFDTEKTAGTDVAKLLLAIVNWSARATSHDARSVVPITVRVTVPAGGPFNGSVSVTIPAGVTVIDASPAFASGGTAWNVSALGGTTVDLTVWLRLPNAVGSSNVTVAASIATQPPSASKTLVISVSADRAAIESALGDRLAALVTAIPQRDRHALDDAQGQLAALRIANPSGTAATLAVVDRVMALIQDLQSISINTNAARADADRLLVYWQTKAGG